MNGQNRDWARVKPSPFELCRERFVQNVRMSNPMGRESLIFGQKTLRAVQGHSRVSGKRQSVSCRVFFLFFVPPLCRIVRTDADKV